jgi:hypothetical protein
VTVDHHFKDPTLKFKQGQGQPEVQIVNNLHIHNIKPNMSYTIVIGFIPPIAPSSFVFDMLKEKKKILQIEIN